MKRHEARERSRRAFYRRRRREAAGAALMVLLFAGVAALGTNAVEILGVNSDAPTPEAIAAALADRGGWCNPDIAHWFADYCDVVMRAVGDRVYCTAPINEPWCVAWLSHFMGLHAPGLRDIRAAARAMHHVCLAHGQAIQAMRALGVRNLGCVTNHEYVAPFDDSPEAAAAARLYDGIYNRWFLGAFRNGEYPADVLEGLAPYLPEGWQDDMDVIAQPVDWLGLNYYTRKLIAPGPSGLWGDLRDLAGDLPQTTMGWEVYPEGLHHFLTQVHAEYGRGLPIYVTENGMSADDVLTNGAVDDQERIDYLNAHFAAARRAIAEGVPLKGFFCLLYTSDAADE